MSATSPPATAEPEPEPEPEPTDDSQVPQQATPTPQPTSNDAEEDAGNVEVLSLLDDLQVAAENDDGYDRSHYEHSRRELCNTLGTDPYTGLAYNPSSCDVDHIVAAKEAHESGGHSWTVARRNQFGNAAENLIASRDCVNRSKGSRDIAEWDGVESGACGGSQLTAAGACFWAIRTVEVKFTWSLSVDPAERAALERTLNGCDGATSGATQLPAAAPTPSEPDDGDAEDDCHPSYRPCLPNRPGDALNCGDLRADQKPVTVIGDDPYRFDRDGDGRGCTS